MSKENTVAIIHDHTMYSLAKRRNHGEKAVFSRYYAPEFRSGGVNVVGWVIGGDPPFFGIENKNAWWGSLELIDMIWQEADESKDSLTICTNCHDIERTVSEGKIAIILMMEGGFALNNDKNHDPLMKLRILYQLGLRSFQFVGQDWNTLINATRNHPFPSQGLSSSGKSVVREMNKLGMIIDTAHIPDPDPLFQDILEMSQHPIIDSHRGVRGVTDIDRNISDQRIKTIAQTCGVIGLQFFSVVLSNDIHRQATADDLIRHIDHIVQLVGVDHVSLGPGFLDPELADRKPDFYVKDFESIRKISQVADALLKQGYSDLDIRKIMGENILRVYKQVLG